MLQNVYMTQDWQRSKANPPVEDGTRSEVEKMRADEWFKYQAGSLELVQIQRETIAVCREVNEHYFDDPARYTAMIADLIADCGPGLDLRPAFFIEYGERVTIGSNVFINSDFMVVGSGRITIGNNVLIGPSARFYTPNHALDIPTRREGWEIGLPITLEDDVWLGGSVVICPGVTIGAGSIVGAGSVVTKDVPPGVVVGGNPARIIREL